MRENSDRGGEGMELFSVLIQIVEAALSSYKMFP